jgi:hypothetical protein
LPKNWGAVCNRSRASHEVDRADLGPHHVGKATATIPDTPSATGIRSPATVAASSHTAFIGKLAHHVGEGHRRETIFRIERASNDWKERISKRTAPDHERTMNLVCDVNGKSGIRIGDRMITSITPEVADKLYAKVRDTPVRKGKTSRPRTAERVVAICRHRPHADPDRAPQDWRDGAAPAGGDGWRDSHVVL